LRFDRQAAFECGFDLREINETRNDDAVDFGGIVGQSVFELRFELQCRVSENRYLYVNRVEFRIKHRECVAVEFLLDELRQEFKKTLLFLGFVGERIAVGNGWEFVDSFPIDGFELFLKQRIF